jgi:hypothetical protein
VWAEHARHVRAQLSVGRGGDGIGHYLESASEWGVTMLHIVARAPALQKTMRIVAVRRARTADYPLPSLP